MKKKMNILAVFKFSMVNSTLNTKMDEVGRYILFLSLGSRHFAYKMCWCFPPFFFYFIPNLTIKYNWIFGP